jgi:hypothetical protein
LAGDIAYGGVVINALWSLPRSPALVFSAQSIVVAFQRHVEVVENAISVFQREDATDTGEVDTRGDEFADSLQSNQIISAVAAGTPGAAVRGHESVPFVQTQRLFTDAG